MYNWFVINTKPKKEFQVERLFHEGGIDFYCPRYIHETRSKPFFSGYGFIYFEYPEQYKLVRYTRGVKRVIVLLNYVSYQGQVIIEKKKLKKVTK